MPEFYEGSSKMNPIRLIKHQLYLLQLENYNLERFFRAVILSLRPKLWPPRKELVFTPKMGLIFGISVLLGVLVAISLASFFAGFLLQTLVFLGALYFFSFVFFVFLIAAAVVTLPLDFAAKSWIVFKARRKMRQFKNLRVIAITGSYGKTTMKEILSAVLRQNFRVLKTADSVNTPVGIARLILSSLNPETQIFIVEMGAYHIGEIKKMCEMVKPAVAILTGINEAHLERFGSLDNTIAAKFEIVKHSRPNATVFLNEDNALVKQNHSRYSNDRKTVFYSTAEIQSKKFLPELPGMEFEIEGIRHQIPFLSGYILGEVAAAVKIAKSLDMPKALIHNALDHLNPIPHRLQPIRSPGDVLVIDDSYSGNPEGVEAAIEALSMFDGRRKLYITPGLVEMGEKLRDVHVAIGKRLAGVADIVILIKNSVTPFIYEGIVCAPSEKAKVLWFENSIAAHSALPKIIKSGDVVLFQNDWPENYT